MMDALGVLLARLTGRRTLELLCAGILLSIAGSGIAEKLYRAEVAPYVALILAGLFIGWTVGRSPLPGWAAGMFCGSLAAWTAIFWAGRLDRPLWDLLSALGLRTAGALFRIELGAGTAGHSAAMRDALGRLMSGLAAEGSRLRMWIADLSLRPNAYDPLAATLVWSLGFLLLGLFAGWAFRVRARILAASLPAVAALGAMLVFAHGNWHYMLAVFAVLLLMIILENQGERLRLWQQRGLDYAESIHFDVALSTAPWVAGILVCAAVIPQIDIDEISRQVREALESKPAAGSSSSAPTGAPAAGSYGTQRLNTAPTYLGVGEIPQLTQDLVMIVYVDPPDGMPWLKGPNVRHYWRGQVYDSYNGRAWTSGDTREQEYEADAALTPDAPPGTPLRERVAVYEPLGQLVFYTGMLASVDEPYKALWRSDGDLFSASAEKREYTVLSYVILPDETALRASGTDYPQWIRGRYLTLPSGVPLRVFSLAREWTASAVTPFEQALAIEKRLREYPYSLDVPPAPTGHDPVDYFLFEQKKGFCNYSASAMVVLARASGIPARLVLGYATGEFNRERDGYIVRKLDYHAWPELYFEGVGWVEFEPTSSRPGIPHTSTPEEELPPAEPSFLPGAIAVVWRWLEGALPVIGAVFGGLVAVLAVWFALTFTGTRLRIRTLPTGEAVRLMYRRLVGQARRLNVPLSPSTTPREFTARFVARCRELKPDMPAAGIREISRLYEQLVFREASLSDGDRRRAYREWAQLDGWLWRLRMEEAIRKLRRRFDPRRRSRGSRHAAVD